MTETEYWTAHAARIEGYQRLHASEMSRLHICGQPREYRKAKRVKPKRPKFWARST